MKDDTIKTFSTVEQLTYTVKQLAEALQISIPTAHDMTHIEGFPCIWVGRKKIIPIEPLKEWLKTYSGGAVD